LGRTHRNNDTFPRIADPFCYVDKDDIFHAVRCLRRQSDTEDNFHLPV